MTKNWDKNYFADEISIKAVRGSGPGGQNVNKGNQSLYTIFNFTF